LRTIGTRWPRSAPLYDHQASCAYCGVPWRRSQLRKDRSGLLSCPDEGDGLTALECDLEAARNARDGIPRPPPQDGANVDRYPPREMFTYNNPLTRFGDDLVGWYQPLTGYVTTVGTGITAIADRSRRGNHLAGGIPGFNLFRPVLSVDADLGIPVASLGGLLSPSGLLGVTATTPISVFMTAKVTTYPSAEVALVNLASSGGTQSALRIGGPGTRARYQTIAAGGETTSSYIASDVGVWHVYGIVWTDENTVQFTVDGVVRDERAAPTLTERSTSAAMDTLGASGSMSEWAMVQGEITANDAAIQSGWMAQNAGL